LDVPRLSTYPIGVIINRAVATMPPDTAFVNVGTWHGYSFFAGMAGNPERRCIGIDDFSMDLVPTDGDGRTGVLGRFGRVRAPAHEFHDVDFHEYFASQHEGPIGFYAYDAPPGIDGFEAAERFFAPGCAVIVDDAFSEKTRADIDGFLDARPGQYEVIFDRPT